MTGLLKHLRAILLLPGMVAGVVPAIILLQTGSLNTGGGLPFPFNLALPASGGLLLVSGLILLGVTTYLFAVSGNGTLAPWDPTQKLVVRGLYRYLRNPMISGVFLVLVGESMLAGSRPLLAWAVVFLLINLVYIPSVEEPGLERRFGEAYREYRRNVPPWIPRLRPWEG